jgi:hypothetical protein
MPTWLPLSLPVEVARWIDRHIWPYRGLRADVKAAKAAIRYWPPPPS